MYGYNPFITLGVPMPKINVYLPDDLADAVRESGVPVSAICQRALEQAVRRVTAIRETTLTDLDDAALAGRLTHFTARARQVLLLGVQQAQAGEAASVGTEHLLGGVLDEGGNLALQVLGALEIEPDAVRRALDRETAAPGGPAPEETRFSAEAAAVLELAVTEATALGHNYVGCEHLLLGLVTEPDGTAGRVLRGLGAEPRLTRRAVSAALVGYAHLQANTAARTPDPAAALAAAVRAEIQPLAERITRLEQRAGVAE